VTSVWLAAPDDSVTAEIAARLPGCTVSITEPPSGAEIAVYRPGLRNDKPDLAEAEAFFQRAAGSRRGVVLSSAAIHTPHHHNPGYVPEPYRSQGSNSLSEAWRELAAERLSGVETIVLRPAHVAARDAGGLFARLFSSRSAVVPPGFDPALQFLSPEDLAEAVALAVERGAGRPGTYHVAPRGIVSVRGALRLAGVRRMPLGWTAAGGWGDFLRHNATVSGRRIETELGFVPRQTSAEALLSALGHEHSTAPDFDDFGLDERYIAAYERTLFRFLHDLYWRVELQGLENVPRQGSAVLTGIHRGFMPWDGVMALVAVHRATGRIPRFLIHPCLIKQPFLANYMTKLGGLLACQENAAWVLGRGELLGMFPEGIHGALTPYRDAYKLGKFGRDEYVKMALRNRAPIVPFVTTGSAEIYPILGRLDWKWVKRTMEWPYLPLCPNFPFPGLPLPSKWHTRFLEPMHVEQRYGPEVAADAEVVRAISAEVRSRMEEALQGMLRRRRSIFFGSIFEPTVL
jgi:1-acyl-sn-glycerol-3-phosphate acyltransferase